MPKKTSGISVRKRLPGLWNGADCVVVFRHAGEPVAEGKFLLGHHKIEKDLVAVVFDNSAKYHVDLATKYKLHPIGGGHLRVDFRRRQITLWGRSEAFGEEPDRGMTRQVIEAALPDYECQATS